MNTQFVLGAVIFASAVLLDPVIARAVSPYSGEVLDVVGAPTSEFLGLGTIPITASQFETRVESISEPVPFAVEYCDDAEMEWGQEYVVREGKDGERTRTYQITSWGGEEFVRKLIADELVPPEAEIVSRGTKIVWREVPEKGYQYWAKLRVWATSYDGNCAGCRGLTYSGTLVRQGVCAVDPQVIPLGTNFYVPGYGICRAEDIGGGIKGNKVDLGFEDVRHGFWFAHYTDVYLLSNAPE